MILYRPLEHRDNEYNTNLWVILPENYNIKCSDFKTMCFKISNTEYHHCTDEFKKVYDRELIWRALKKD